MIRALVMILPPLLAIGFAVYALIDAARSDAERIRNLPKGAWISLIVLFNVVGSAAWFIAGRPKGQSVPKPSDVLRREPELPARGAAPDDDEEYLRWLEQQAKRKRDSSVSDSQSSTSKSSSNDSKTPTNEENQESSEDNPENPTSP
ncbi:MAG: PLD nuclease N-terminal domain-containing protein [Rothia sp. (in: high G+C Gram-positive bacteria)]|uniref:PLD nuclease N-terminal domain-containing protein n=1 Tax=Rothia sp. (in: high G+C Gram-positive bacteria) TaxID=1885016 RepID=UPI0026E00287|nr:PLD nuclease N-terminal domain-containing protein [Rothia sp. (in: high G+C Gram-positive bacteria)]MDO5751152.1 PLD nuclease N-terminal domain-containing protein [Rothia sp. (in: high G+C Gram-positive bacteria)]